MRDLLVYGIVFGSLPLMFVRPWWGTLIWFWLAFMSPHRLTWGSAKYFNFSQYAALALIGAWLVKGEKKFPITAVGILVAIYFCWVTITTIGGFSQHAAWWKYDRFWKTLLTTIITICLITDRKRLQVLLWVAVMSLGFHGIKGGWFTIRTGGQYEVWGPTGSFIADNNQLAMALVMLLPFYRYLQLSTQNKYVRVGVLICGGLIFASILGSQSRGAFLAVSAMGAFMWWKSRKKLALGLIGIVAVVFVLSFMPQSWFDRMNSIENYDNDKSAMGRLDAWTFSIKLADRRLIGGGFNVHGNGKVYYRYYPGGSGPRAAHSVYFEVLGEQGWIGLGMFLTILAVTFKMLGTTARMARQRPELVHMRDLCMMMQVSLVGYATNGAFLNLATFDLYWLIIGLAIITRRIVTDELAATESETAEAPVPNGVGAPALAGRPAVVTGGQSGFLIRR